MSLKTYPTILEILQINHINRLHCFSTSVGWLPRIHMLKVRANKRNHLETWTPLIDNCNVKVRCIGSLKWRPMTCDEMSFIPNPLLRLKIIVVWYEYACDLECVIALHFKRLERPFMYSLLGISQYSQKVVKYGTCVWCLLIHGIEITKRITWLHQ